MLKRYLSFCRLFVVYMRVKIIVWDLDGTLYFSPKVIENLRNLYIRYYIKISGKDRLHFLSLEKEGIDWIDIIKDYEDVGQKEIINKLEASFNKERWVNKNKKLVGYFNKSSKINYLFTNSTWKQAISIINKIGINNTSHVFKEIITLDNMSEAKPSPKAFNILLKKLKNFDRSDVLYVGDSIKHDIVPAKKNGFNTLFINNWKISNHQGLNYMDIDSALKDLILIDRLTKNRIVKYFHK